MNPSGPEENSNYKQVKKTSVLKIKSEVRKFNPDNFPKDSQ